MTRLSAEELRALAERAVRGEASAIRLRVRLEPAGGSEARVMPPTYLEKEGSNKPTYAVDTRLDENGRKVATILLDSVQSQANRFEEYLLEASKRGDIRLPMIRLQPEGMPGISAYEAPHRVYDAYIVYGQLDGKPFPLTDLGRRIYGADQRNATALYEWCPTVLLFGGWASHSWWNRGTGARIERALASEIVGWGSDETMLTLQRPGGRRDPFQVPKEIPNLTIYQAQNPEETGELITDDRTKAVTKNGQLIKVGGKDSQNKAGKPAAAGLAGVPPTLVLGGVSIRYATQIATISMVQLRRLGFPDENGERTEERDAAARAVLALMGIYVLQAQCDAGYDLRSGCFLNPESEGAIHWERVGRTLSEVEPFGLDREAPLAALKAEIEKAESLGLKFGEKEIVLKPGQTLKKILEYRGAEEDGEAEPGE